MLMCCERLVTNDCLLLNIPHGTRDQSTAYVYAYCFAVTTSIDKTHTQNTAAKT